MFGIGDALSIADQGLDYANSIKPSIWSRIGDSLIENSGDIVVGAGGGLLSALGAKGVAESSRRETLEGLRLQGQIQAELQKERLAAELQQLRVQEKLAREAQLQQAFQNIISTTLAGGDRQSGALTNIITAGQNALR